MENRSSAEDWAAVSDAIRERMRELKMSKARLAREAGMSETTIRYLGRPGSQHRRSALVAISGVLRWRYDHLTNILHGRPDENAPARPAAVASLERLLRVEVGPLRDDLSRLTETVQALDEKIGADGAQPEQDRDRDPRGTGLKTEAISDLPMLYDMDADYSPQYVKLARILRGKIESSEYQHGDALPAAELAHEYGVSVRVAQHALAMLAGNRYVRQPGKFAPYTVT